MHCNHSICMLHERYNYAILYNKVRESIKQGYCVIYTDAHYGETIKRMSGLGINVEGYIEKGALQFISMESLYGSRQVKEGKLSIADYWYSVISKNLKKAKFRGIFAVNISDAFVKNNEDYNQLIQFENIISQKFNQPARVICCYNTKLANNMSLGYLISCLMLHNCTVHSRWEYREWHSSTIIELICNGIDKILGHGSAVLMLKTLKLVYNMNNDLIISHPDVFEDTVRRIIGDSSNVVFDAISEQILNKMMFDRIVEAA